VGLGAPFVLIRHGRCADKDVKEDSFDQFNGIKRVGIRTG
jgi:hypothetical protein